MLSPAILNRSMPRTVVSGMPCPLSVSLNAYLANFHLLKISILGGQAHLRADQLFLFEPCVHNSNIGADSIEPSVYLPPGTSIFLLQLVDRKSTRLNSSHPSISYAVFCL